MQTDQLKAAAKKTRGKKPHFLVFFERLLMVPLGILIVSLFGSYSLDRWVLKPIEHQQTVLRSTERQVGQLNRQIEHYQKYAVGLELDGAPELISSIDKIKWVDKLTAYSKEKLITKLSLMFGDEVKMLPAETVRIPQDQSVFYQMPIVVEASVFHEGDVIRLIDWFYQQQKYLWLQSCQLRLEKIFVNDLTVFDVTQPNIGVRCQFVSFRAEPRLFNEEEWR
jgi:hypothetical protein